MLSVESVRSTKNEREEDEGSFLIGSDDDFANGSLLDDINFDDLFVGIEDGDLPDLEMDPEMLAEFSSVEESDQVNVSSSASEESFKEVEKEERKEKVGENSNQGEESAVTTTASESSGSERRRRLTSSSHTAEAKVAQGKRKVKVDWTPELHRRFVQAVEQLGVDKAVPSRILELMGIDCLTRHNIASHLQKYRSHRKHLLAREAEAANWSQRRQLYGGGRNTGAKREMAPWLAPTIGFPPPAALPFRPLHVWGHPHPTVDQPMMHVWPKHLVRSPTPSPAPPWVPPVAPHPHPPPNRPYWLPHHQLVGSHLTQGTPYYPQPPLTPTRFPAPPVPGIPQAMFKPDAHVPVPTGQPDSRLQIDFNPSKETIDAALGDVLAKPWLPLPLGLKPPSMDSVLVELQRQGISKIPPSCA